MRARSTGRSATQTSKRASAASAGVQSPSILESLAGLPQILFENHPRPLLLYDPEDFRILAVSNAAVEFYGYPREELLSMTVLDLRPPEDLERFQQHVRRSPQAHAVKSGPWRHRRKDGTEFLVEVAATEMEFMGRRVRLAAAHDVTTRERALTALKESESLKASILAAVQDGVVAADMDGRILEFNPAAERMFGYARADLVGKEVAETIIPPDMRAQHRRAMADYAATGERHMIGRTAEMVGLRADGTEFPIEVTLEAIEVAGQPAFTAFIRDLTERRGLDARLAAGFGAARALAEARGLEEAARSVLRTVCQAMGWDLGAVWVVDVGAPILRLAEIWCGEDVDATPFAEDSRRRVFPRGLSLPGMVWARGRPVWIPEIPADRTCPRHAVAAACGLRSAVAFPLAMGEEILGVAEFFGRELSEPDQGVHDLFAALGSRFGLYLHGQRERLRHEASDRMLASVLEHAPLGIVLLDPDLTVKLWNPEMEAIFGWTAKEMVGMPYPLVVPKEQREHFRRHYHTVLEGREFVSSESWRMRKDGTPVHVSISGAPVYDAQGQVIGIVGLYVDLGRPKPV